MGKRTACIIFSFCFLAGCAGTQGTVSSVGDYVEIDNPGFTMSPGAPPTIWVPRTYVDSGVPRGGELLEKGYDAVRGKLSDNGRQAIAQAPVSAPPSAAVTQTAPSPVVPPTPVATPVAVPTPLPAKTAVASSVRNRILVVETGQSGLLARSCEALRQASAGTVPDPGQAAFVARYAAVGTSAERGALAVKLREDFGANLVLFISAPGGTDPGKAIGAELHEGQGGTLLRKIDVMIPDYAGTGAIARDTAIASALRKLAAEVREVAGIAPWYGTVVTVEGERVYINAGKETGIGLGQRLNLYRSGKVLEKLGFAPGQKFGILEITGFVGMDGAYGIVKQGAKAQASDLVGIE